MAGGGELLRRRGSRWRGLSFGLHKREAKDRTIEGMVLVLLLLLRRRRHSNRCWPRVEEAWVDLQLQKSKERVECVCVVVYSVRLPCGTEQERMKVTKEAKC